MSDNTDPNSFGPPDNFTSPSQTPIVPSPSESQVEPSLSVNQSE